MKYLKYLIIFLILALIIPALLPSNYQVERSIHIDASQEDVFSYLVNLEAWPEWSPWLEKEPTAEYQFSGIPGVVGSSQQWAGKEIGAGKQTLTALQEPAYIETRLNFSEPQTSTATSYFKIRPEQAGVDVIWGMKGSSSYPFERVIALFLPAMIGEDFNKGLNNLKKQLESSDSPN